MGNVCCPPASRDDTPLSESVPPFAGAAATALPFGTPRRVVVYDWDDTITSQHMYKVLSDWSGYSEHFEKWCAAEGITSPLAIPLDRTGIVSRMGFGGVSSHRQSCPVIDTRDGTIF